MKSASAEGIPQIGQPYGGGILLGCSFVGAVPYATIKAPRALGELEASAWSKSMKRVDGALSAYDGLANTHAMLAAGSSLAQWAADLRIGDQADWYIPARGELLLGFDVNQALPEAERFEEEWYWSSSQCPDDPGYAYFQSFGDGSQNWTRKSNELRVVAVRRVPLYQFQIQEPK